MSRYIPTPSYYDTMPIDISFVFQNEKPAGKHGFIRCDGDDFRFEDGTVGKFWGVIFNGGANFPSHDYSEKVAKRLSMAGCNIVRLHQLDAQWGLPNIYQLYAGPKLNTTRVFCPESLDRLDYLIHCLKKEGIYVAVDMLTFRNFKSGDGVKHGGEIQPAEIRCDIQHRAGGDDAALLGGEYVFHNDIASSAEDFKWLCSAVIIAQNGADMVQ